MCFRQGVFPRELTLARVIPIYKSSSKQSFSNYRPFLPLYLNFWKKYYTIISLSSWTEMILFVVINLALERIILPSKL